MSQDKTINAPSIDLAIKVAVAKRSYDLLYIHNPEIAYAIEQDIKNGASPEQVKYATYQMTQSNEFAAKVYAAAIHIVDSMEASE